MDLTGPARMRKAHESDLEAIVEGVIKSGIALLSS